MKTTAQLSLLSSAKSLLSTFVLCALLAQIAPTHAGQMLPSDGAPFDKFGGCVSVSGTIGLVGAIDADGLAIDNGAVYVYRNLDTSTGTVTQQAKLIGSDVIPNDMFAVSNSISGYIALVGAHQADGNHVYDGAAYLYRNLNTVTGTVLEDAKLIASDGAISNYFGVSVSISGTIGLVGAELANLNTGAAYVFRNLDTATGTITENAKLLASDGANGDLFGSAVSLSGTTSLVAARWADIGANQNQGSAYVFRNLGTVTGTVNQNAKLVASDGSAGDQLGWSLSFSGAMGLVGTPWKQIGANTDQGSAYVFRNLDTATGTVFENAKLLASDGETNDFFGYSVSLSGNVGLVGASFDDRIIGYNNHINQGSAYIFRNIDTVSGTVNESVKLFATNGISSDNFGNSVYLDGDNFVIGAVSKFVFPNYAQGTAYFGHVRTFTTANLGNDSTLTDGLSFEARDNWIIGQTTSNNTVTLSNGDSGNVGRVGLNPLSSQTNAQTFIGQNAGSNNNTLHVESGATLTSNSIHVGASGNSGNQLRANGTINLSSGSVLNVFDGNILSGSGTIQGHAGNTTNNVVISGSLRPGSGAGGSGIGTLTRHDGNVTWNGNASSPWVFELGIAKATMALANTSGTRDLLNITAGDFLKGTGSSFVFDFAGTGWGGWYKLVDWVGTTNFSASDFTAININPVVTSYQFFVDNGLGSTTALYIYMIPEPQVWVVLSAVLGGLIALRIRMRKAAKVQNTTAA